MTYESATRYVEGLAILGMRFGLERMHRLLDAMGRPNRCAPAIHVVGTNGKSSTCRLAAASLAGQGRSVGTYLSPHVVGWRERIEIDGEAISEAQFAAAVGRVRDSVDRLGLAPDDQVTQFEVLTAAGFVAFADAAVDVMVVEAGLGGRWDATNVLGDDAVVVLTNVALEHTELLGDSEAAIAAEKLAVAPDGSGTLVIGSLSDRASVAVREEIARRRLTAWWEGRDVTVTEHDGLVDVATPWTRYTDLPLPLLGAFQRDNLAVAIAAAERRLGASLDLAALRASIATVTMPGRLEVVPGRPQIVMDGAHNPAGMEAMAGSLASVTADREVIAVMSVLGDKDATAMVAPLARVCSRVIATRSSHDRAAAPEVLAHLGRLAGMDAEIVEDPFAAVERARSVIGPDGAVLICGSLYLLADVRARVLAASGARTGMLAGETAGNRGRTKGWRS